MLKVDAIAQFHDEFAARFFGQDIDLDSFLGQSVGEAVAINHISNCRLWREEDRVRVSVDDSAIAVSKKAIDGFNQIRNDAVERIDEEMLQSLDGSNGSISTGARLSSETPGAMIDRLSILSLKIFHMRFQSSRSDCSDSLLAHFKVKSEQLNSQRADLCFCLDRLLLELVRGESFFRIFRQHKMYNDPIYRQDTAKP